MTTYQLNLVCDTVVRIVRIAAIAYVIGAIVR